MTAQVSPDLPPGRTLSVSGGGDVTIVAAAGAPAVDIGRAWVIEVMDSPIATVYNRTQSKTYSRQWNLCMDQANHGDLIEISPGAVHGATSEMNNYFNGLDSCMLAVSKGVRIRNIPGRGRWSLFPGDEVLLTGNKSGIVVFSPEEMGGRFPISIEGFAFDNWGQFGDSLGVRIRERLKTMVRSRRRSGKSATA